MPTTYIAAKDEMFAAVNTALIGAVVIAALGYTPDVRWPGVPKAAKPDPSKLWARVSLQVVTDQQASLSSVNDKRFFEATGLIFVQLFCPRDVAASVENGLIVATVVQNVFRHSSTSGEIWYRNAKIVELPESDESYPILVSAQYQYKTLST